MGIKGPAVDICLTHYIGNCNTLKIFLLHQLCQCLTQQLFCPTNSFIFLLYHDITSVPPVEHIKTYRNATMM